MTTPCIVCNAEIETGKEVYANLWEASLKTHPCCSQGCAAKFHVDVHWIPPAQPVLLENERALERPSDAARSRLHRGERPENVVRDLLLAGVGPARVRVILQRVVADLENPPVDNRVTSANRLSFWTGLFGFVAGLFTGWFFIAGTSGGSWTSSSADTQAMRDAETIVDAWERHFALPPSRSHG